MVSVFSFGTRGRWEVRESEQPPKKVYFFKKVGLSVRSKR